MATPQQFLERAASYIGVGGTDNIFNTWCWGYHCYDPNMYPWCAAFQSYIGIHDLGMSFSKSASAAGVANQGIRVADEDARPGDWALFNWDGRQTWGWADHIAVVEWSDITGSGYFGTIDGNSGGGEGVVQRNTYYNWGSYGTAFFRPPYDGSAPTPEPSPAPASGQPYYNVYAGGWCGKMDGRVDTTGSGDDFGGILGVPMGYIAMGGVGSYQVCTAASGWLPAVDKYDTGDYEYGCAGDGSHIYGVRITDPSVHYQTHNLGGGWNDVMVGTTDTGGSGDDYAGEYGVPQDAIRAWRE